MERKGLTKKSLLAAVLGLTVAFSSCEKTETPVEPTEFESKSAEVLNANPDNLIEGDITADMTITEGEYVMNGPVYVKSGATLTIEPGVTIYSKADEVAVAYLLVEQGAKIMAEGTAAKPIVMTSGKLEEDRDRGDWGGVIIAGYAPINKGETATVEVGDAQYGGSDAADNSGVLKYVRLEYTGNIINSEKEHNGLSLCGVGNGTEIDYVQVFMGKDDGFEFFGGTVNAKHLVSTGSKDDSFDWTYGWSGKGQFWVAHQAADGGDRGIEGDNNGSDNAANPYSNPTLANVTLIGQPNAENGNQGLKLREGTKGMFYNFIVTGFPKRGVQVEHDVTLDNLNNGELVFANSIVDNVEPFKYSASENSDKEATVMFDEAQFMNVVAEDGSAAKVNGFVGTVSENAKSTSEIDAWFSAADYIGAVESGNDWTTGWTKQVGDK